MVVNTFMCSAENAARRKNHADKNDSKNDGMSRESKCEVPRDCEQHTMPAQLFNAVNRCYSATHDARRLSYRPGSLLAVVLLPAGVRGQAHRIGDRQLRL